MRTEKLIGMSIALAAASLALVATAGAKVQNGVIAYSTYQSSSGGNDIWYTSPFSSSTATSVTAPFFSDTDREEYPAFSADGSKLAFSARKYPEQNWDIYLMDSDSSSQPVNLTNTANATETHPAFSPDGAKIAYAGRTVTHWDIFIMSSNGDNPTNLTPGGSGNGDSNPTFSPDGKRIAFDSDRDGDMDIYTMDTDGGSVVNLTNNGAGISDIEPSYSPDGKKIALSSDRQYDIPHIVQVDSTTGAELETPSTTTDSVEPVYSPDGSMIAFAGEASGYAHAIITVDLLNGRLTKVTDPNYYALQPAWQSVSIPDDSLPVPPVGSTEGGKLSVSCSMPRLKAGKTKRIKRRAFKRRLLRGFHCEARNAKGVKGLGASLKRIATKRKNRAAKGRGAFTCYRIDRPEKRSPCHLAQAKGQAFTADRERKAISIKYMPLANTVNGELQNNKQARKAIRKMRKGRYMLLFKAYIHRASNSKKLKRRLFKFYLNVR